MTNVVGVPGFLLGGGISFFGNGNGWAFANVVQYDVRLTLRKSSPTVSMNNGSITAERQPLFRHVCLIHPLRCVLGNGNIVSATASNEDSVLFWALRGGDNPTAIVVGFYLKSFSLTEVAIDEDQYSPKSSAQFLESIYFFALDGSNNWNRT